VIRKPRVQKITGQAELAQAFSIRIRVFVKEQHVPAEIELDRDDQRAQHFLATIDGRAVGTARLVLRRGSAKIGRMAVIKGYRRRGIGALLLKHAVAAAKRVGARPIYLHAQVAALGFYQAQGFRATGSVFDEAGIAHRKMILPSN
jgi:predicted GNAT family N-acyltransferase